MFAPPSTDELAEDAECILGLSVAKGELKL
jgi:hypothetical protein